MKYSLRDVTRLRMKSEEEARRTEIWYGRYFVRSITRYFTWASLAVGVSANAVTVLSYVVGIASAVSFGLAGSSGTLWGVILLHTAFVVDNVDGEVARVSGTGSMTGAYLDTLGHIVVNGAVLFGVAYGEFVTYGHWWIIPVGFVAAFCHVPISRYSIDHEILGRIRAAIQDRSLLPPSSRPAAPAPNGDHVVESTVKAVRWLKRIGFPFNSTPFNILLITAVSVYDGLTARGWFPGLPLSGLTLMMVYFSVVLLLQQLGSLVRNTQRRAVDEELQALLERLR